MPTDRRTSYHRIVTFMGRYRNGQRVKTQDFLRDFAMDVAAQKVTMRRYMILLQDWGMIKKVEHDTIEIINNGSGKDLA